MSPKIAVLIPCYNEEKSVRAVVEQARRYLPEADIYVYDNNSADKTAEIARDAGAIVRFVRQQGKGSTVRRMFSDIDADIYVMTDGDTTYDLSRAPELVDYLISNQLDMVVGARKEQEEAAYRRGHRLGNYMLTRLVGILFGVRARDMLSGYRVFTKRFVKTFPAVSKGFEIETELNVFTHMNSLPFAEIDTDYFARPEGSVSKLSTYKDGFKILRMILRLICTEKPLLFFSAAAFFFILPGAVAFRIAVPFNIPLLFACVLAAFLCFFTGIIRSGQLKSRRETGRLAYLHYPLFTGKDN